MAQMQYISELVAVFILPLWREYHEVYTKKYQEYEKERRKAGKEKFPRGVRLSHSEYKPAWAAFLLDREESEVQARFATYKAGRLETFKNCIFQENIEVLLKNLETATKAIRRQNKLQEQGGKSRYALAIGGCTTGRHETRSAASVYWYE